MLESTITALLIFLGLLLGTLTVVFIALTGFPELGFFVVFFAIMFFTFYKTGEKE
jgi:hypothetical protein